MSSATEAARTDGGRKFIVKKEAYGESIEIIDSNPDTRFQAPPDERSFWRKFFDRLLLGIKPYRPPLF
jgi:hypothetical protein